MEKPYRKSKAVWGCALLFVYAVSGYLTGNVPATDALAHVAQALAVFGVRDALT